MTELDLSLDHPTGCFYGSFLDDSRDGNGDLGWDPDGWPTCSEHRRTMKPIQVVEMDRVADMSAKPEEAA